MREERKDMKNRLQMGGAARWRTSREELKNEMELAK